MERINSGKNQEAFSKIEAEKKETIVSGISIVPIEETYCDFLYAVQKKNGEYILTASVPDTSEVIAKDSSEDLILKEGKFSTNDHEYFPDAFKGKSTFQEGVAKPALTLSITLSRKDQIFDISSISISANKAKLEKVYSPTEANEALAARSAEKESMSNLLSLSNLLVQRHKRKNPLYAPGDIQNAELSEAAFLHEHGEDVTVPWKIVRRELRLLVNEAAALYAKEHDIPVLYRANVLNPRTFSQGYFEKAYNNAVKRRDREMMRTIIQQYSYSFLKPYYTTEPYLNDRLRSPLVRLTSAFGDYSSIVNARNLIAYARGEELQYQVGDLSELANYLNPRKKKPTDQDILSEIRHKTSEDIEKFSNKTFIQYFITAYEYDELSPEFIKDAVKRLRNHKGLYDLVSFIIQTPAEVDSVLTDLKETIIADLYEFPEKALPYLYEAVHSKYLTDYKERINKLGANLYKATFSAKKDEVTYTSKTFRAMQRGISKGLAAAHILSQIAGLSVERDEELQELSAKHQDIDESRIVSTKKELRKLKKEAARREQDVPIRDYDKLLIALCEENGWKILPSEVKKIGTETGFEIHTYVKIGEQVISTQSYAQKEEDIKKISSKKMIRKLWGPSPHRYEPLKDYEERDYPAILESSIQEKNLERPEFNFFSADLDGNQRISCIVRYKDPDGRIVEMVAASDSKEDAYNLAAGKILCHIDLHN